MDLEFKVNPEEFQARKRRRIMEMNKRERASPGPAPISAPGVHEIMTFLPGRLEFEHELDNEAEDLIKDLDFGVVYQYGGDQILEDEHDLDVKARKKWEEDKLAGLHDGYDSATPGPSFPSNGMNGHHPNGIVVKKEVKSEDVVMSNGTGEDDGSDEPVIPQPYETDASLEFKLTLLEMYFQRVERRMESKAFMFDRGLLEYKKVSEESYFVESCAQKFHPQMQAAEKKRPKEEKEFLHRLRPFARLQTSADYEAFSTDMLCESSNIVRPSVSHRSSDEAILRKRIQELQQYRRLGLCTPADIEKYDNDLVKRVRAFIFSFLPAVLTCRCCRPKPRQLILMIGVGKVISTFTTFS